MSGDRRLAISSLLNGDDSAQTSFSPLEALVHAATEERRRLTADVPSPPHLLQRNSAHFHQPPRLPYPQDNLIPTPLSPHLSRVPYIDDPRFQHPHQHHLQPQRHPHDPLPPQDHQHLLLQQQQQQQQRQQALLHQQQQQQLDPRFEQDPRHRILDHEQQRLQQFELLRQQEFIRSQHDRQPRIDQRRHFDPLERQREDRLRQPEIDRHRELEHLREEQLKEVREERQREYERQREDRRQRERKEIERQREIERKRDLDQQRERELTIHREQERLHEAQRIQTSLHEPRHRYPDPSPLPFSPQPTPTTSHPPSIAHLISHSPPPHKPDLAQIKIASSPILPDPHHPQQDDVRPAKKRRYSDSPTRPQPDDKERIAREREKMVVGELGYGRVESPLALVSMVPAAPRRPGSGNGAGRKPVAVADLLVDKDRPMPSKPESRDHAHRVLSPLGRRSPPGSQIGRAKAARKSDEQLRELLPAKDPRLPPEPEFKKPKEDARHKEEARPPRHHSSTLDELLSPPEEARVKKKEPSAPTPIPPPPPPPPPKSQQLKPQQQQEDAHEWFLQHFADHPSPTSSRPEPPRSPSPSLSPTTVTVPASASCTSVKSPGPTHKTHTLITAAVALEQELEELVSKPTHSSTLTTSVFGHPASVIKKQEEEEDEAEDAQLAMELDRELEAQVDQAVADLVAETLEGEDDDLHVKHESNTHVGMEVDVEDELLSLVDDHPHPLPISTVPPLSSLSNAPRRSAPGPPHTAPTTSLSPTSVTPTTTKQPTPLRVTSESRHVSPPISATSSSTTSLVSSAVRHPSVRPTSERGSMPPPATTPANSIGGKKVSNVAERAGSVVPPAKKKKETTAKAGKAKGTTGAPAKPRAKPAAKGKKTDAADPAAAPSAPTVTKPAKAPKKAGPSQSVSRSRSASVMPGGTSASVGPESDAVLKAEKQEEEEDSDAANEDDKLYCVCKTKYDEDRFMIACDRCDEWYHTPCVNMPDLEVDLVDQFICPPCIEKHPHLNLCTTYKPRCLYGLRHPDPNSPKACHKAARGAFSKYCSDECGVKYMQSRIDNWAKKGGKTEKLWESVKHADKREGVVTCAVESDVKSCNGTTKMEVDGDAPVKQEVDEKPLVKHRIVPPAKTKVEKETERLTTLLDSVIMLREEMKKGMEVVVWREQLLQRASERAEQVGQCGWDQRLCFDDEEWAELGAAALESYEGKTDGDMEVDTAEEQWWCDGNQICERHAGWQTVRYKDVCKEKEKKEEALVKLTTRERELRKRIEDILDPQNRTSNDTTTTTTAPTTMTTAPLKASNTRLVNGHTKGSKTANSSGDTQKKGKKRKAPVT